MKRRQFIHTITTVSVMAAVGPDLVNSIAYANPLDHAFLSTDSNEILNILFGTADAKANAGLQIDAPLQAENGAVVPIKIHTKFHRVEKIAVVVEGNPVPLLTLLETSPRSGAYYSVRIKMAGTDKVYVYAQADDKLYVASQSVRVVTSGCGG